MFFENIHTYFTSIPLFFGVLSFLFEKREKSLYLFIASSAIGVIVSIAGLIGLSKGLINSSYVFGNWDKHIGIEFIYEKIQACFILSIFIVNLNTALFGIFNKKDKYICKNVGFLMLLNVGLNGLILTNDIFNTYIFIEIVAVSCFVLFTGLKTTISFKNAFDYIILSTISGCFFLIGTGVIYSVTGHLNMSYVNNLSKDSFVNIFAYFFIVFSLFIKIGFYPFLKFIKNFYNSTPFSLMSCIFCVAKVLVFVFYKVTYFCFGTFAVTNLENFWIFIKIVSLWTILSSAIRCFTAKTMKDFLFYSSMISTCFMIMFGVFSNDAVFDSFIYFVSAEMILKSLACLYCARFSSGYIVNENITCYGIFNNYNKSGTTRVYLILLFLSMSYFPITSHFVFKFNFISYFFLNNNFFEGCAILLYTCVSVLYAWRFVEYIAFSNYSKKIQLDNTEPYFFEIISLVFASLMFFMRF